MGNIPSSLDVSGASKHHNFETAAVLGLGNENAKSVGALGVRRSFENETGMITANTMASLSIPIQIQEFA